MTHDEIGEVIKKVVWSQIRDVMFEQEPTELANEAWVAVLESGFSLEQLTPPLVWCIAHRAVVHFKQWQRSSLAVGKDNAHKAIKEVGLSYLSAVPEEALDRHKVFPDTEERKSTRMTLDKALNDVDAIDAMVLWMIERGIKQIRIMETLDRMKEPYSKWRAYNLERIKRAFEPYFKFGKKEKKHDR